MIALCRLQKVLFAAPALAALIAVGSMAVPSTVDKVAATDAETVVTSDASYFAASNCTYYNNALHTTVVGRFGYDCCNNPVAWGKKSPYSVCGGCFPCVPPPH